MNTTCKIFLFLLLASSVLAGGSANPQVAKETPLMTTNLPDLPGKEGLIESTLSPGEVVPAHRHNADVFAYVLEGSIITQLRVVNPGEFTLAKYFTNRPPMYTLRVATRVRRKPQSFSSSL
jgi:hypothetical protein